MCDRCSLGSAVSTSTAPQDRVVKRRSEIFDVEVSECESTTMDVMTVDGVWCAAVVNDGGSGGGRT